MTTYQEGDRIKYTGHGKHAGKGGVVIKVHPKMITVRFDNEPVHTTLSPNNLCAANTGSSDDTRSSTSDALSSNAVSVQHAVQTAVDTFKPKDVFPLMLFTVAAVLQIMTTDALGECSAAMPTAPSSDFKRGDGTSVPCMHKRWLGLNLAQWSTVVVFAAQLVWQKTRPVEKDDESDSFPCDKNTPYRLAHVVFVATCWLELLSKGFQFPFYLLTVVSTASVVWLFLGITTEGAGSDSQVYSSTDSSKTTNHPAWCVSENSFVAAGRLGVLFSLTSLKGAQGPLFGQITAATVMVLYVIIGQYGIRLKDLLRSMVKTLRHGVTACAPDETQLERLDGGSDEELFRRFVNLPEGITDVLKAHHEAMHSSCAKHFIGGFCLGMCVNLYNNRTLLEKLGLLTKQDRFGRSLFVNDPDQYFWSSWIKLDEDSMPGVVALAVCGLLEIGWDMTASTNSLLINCGLVVVQIVAMFCTQRPGIVFVGFCMGFLGGFILLPLLVVLLNLVWTNLAVNTVHFVLEASWQLAFLVINCACR